MKILFLFLFLLFIQSSFAAKYSVQIKVQGEDIYGAKIKKFKLTKGMLILEKDLCKFSFNEDVKDYLKSSIDCFSLKDNQVHVKLFDFLQLVEEMTVLNLHKKKGFDRVIGVFKSLKKNGHTLSFAGEILENKYIPILNKNKLKESIDFKILATKESKSKEKIFLSIKMKKRKG